MATSPARAGEPEKPSAAPTTSQSGPATRPAGPLDFTVTDIDGKERNLGEFRGDVVLLVNVASRCAYTRQYDPLQKLYDKYRDRRFVILGFPSNDFGKQEPGTDEQIKKFAADTYHVTFPMMSKIIVKGPKKHPLYKFLTEKETGGAFAGEIEWNFNKILVGRDGTVIARFGAKVLPDDPKVIEAIEQALGQSPATAPAAGEPRKGE